MDYLSRLSIGKKILLWALFLAVGASMVGGSVIATENITKAAVLSDAFINKTVDKMDEDIVTAVTNTMGEDVATRVIDENQLKNIIKKTVTKNLSEIKTNDLSTDTITRISTQVASGLDSDVRDYVVQLFDAAGFDASTGNTEISDAQINQIVSSASSTAQRNMEKELSSVVKNVTALQQTYNTITQGGTTIGTGRMSQEDYSAIMTQIATNKSEVDTAIEDLKTALSSGSDTNIAQAKSDLEAAIAALTSTVSSNKAASESSVASLTSKLAEVQKAAASATSSSSETLTTAIKDLDKEMNSQLGLTANADGTYSYQTVFSGSDSNVVNDLNTLANLLGLSSSGESGTASASAASGSVISRILYLSKSIGDSNAEIAQTKTDLTNSVNTINTALQALKDADAAFKSTIESISTANEGFEDALANAYAADSAEYATINAAYEALQGDSGAYNAYMDAVDAYTRAKCNLAGVDPTDTDAYAAAQAVVTAAVTAMNNAKADYEASVAAFSSAASGNPQVSAAANFVISELNASIETKKQVSDATITYNEVLITTKKQIETAVDNKYLTIDDSNSIVSDINAAQTALQTSLEGDMSDLSTTLNGTISNLSDSINEKIGSATESMSDATADSTSVWGRILYLQNAASENDSWGYGIILNGDCDTWFIPSGESGSGSGTNVQIPDGTYLNIKSNSDVSIGYASDSGYVYSYTITDAGLTISLVPQYSTGNVSGGRAQDPVTIESIHVMTKTE